MVLKKLLLPLLASSQESKVELDCMIISIFTRNKYRQDGRQNWSIGHYFQLYRSTQLAHP